MKKHFLFLLCLPVVLSATKLQLFLPEVIYAVPGIETNVYFDNISKTINPSAFVFDVDCAKGENLEKRWRFTPTDKEAGSYSWKITVWDDNGIAASAQTRLIVSPRKAGVGKKFSLLTIGDSLTNGLSYPVHLFKLLKTPEDPELEMVGSYHLAGEPVREGGPANEGHAGWRWKTYLNQYRRLPNAVDSQGKALSQAQLRMARHYARSPFLVEKNGKRQLDFQAYFDKYNGGKAPDVITIMLGTNDIFYATDESFEKVCAETFRNMDTFLGALRKAAPNSVIGLATPPPPSASQDGFGKMHGCKVIRWQIKKNMFNYAKALTQKINKSNPYKVSLIPVFINLDCENNYPAKLENINARNQKKMLRHYQNVHPAKVGYDQIGDTFYCWLKYQFTK